MSGSECLCGCECRKPCLAIKQLMQEIKDECATCLQVRSVRDEKMEGNHADQTRPAK